jgi:hypothetical protein
MDWLMSDLPWETVLEKDALKVWKMSVPDSQFVFIKAIATIDASPAAVREVLAPGDIEVVRSYNPMIAEGRDLEYIGRDNKISYSSAHAVWPCRCVLHA